MKNSLQIATLVLTAGVAFGLGWNMRSDGSDSAAAKDPLPAGNTKSSRLRSTGSGRMAASKAGSSRAEDEFVARFKVNGGISAEDMGAAIKEIMAENDPLLRRKMFAALLDELTPENAKDAYLALRESRGRGGPGGRGGRGGDSELALLANAWGRIDGPGAIAALAEMRAESEAAGEGGDRGGRGGRGGGGPDGSVLASVFAGWATADGSAAAAYVGGIEDQREKQMAGFGVLQGMLVNGTDEAMGFIQSIPATEDNGRTRSFYMSMVAGEMLEQGVDAAKDWVGTISDPALRGAALSRVVDQIVREDLEAAVAWVSQYAGDESSARAVARVADRWASSDPQAALDWAGSLPEASQPGVYSQAFEEWTRDDAVAAGEYLQNMQPSAARDAAVESYASGLARSEPVSAVTWAESISDPELRTETLTDVARSWYRRDQSAAATWLADSGLPAESIEEVTTAGGDRRGPDGGGQRRGGGRGR